MEPQQRPSGSEQRLELPWRATLLLMCGFDTLDKGLRFENGLWKWTDFFQNYTQGLVDRKLLR